ncbi:restriction endonuclease subunit S [Streptomyces sp. HYC2]|uniref:restriction endonuclease subunit S n=1 Tax=Streptomyces sp. HYC2 TaxID=2955207 RepID=UPI0024811444|nr:restriction endonuclease subunit S [Streptomyces sp. HYC2]
MTEVPSGWRRVTLSEVAETALGKMLDKGKSKGYPHVPYLRNVNVQWGRIDTDDMLTMELADDERDRFGVLPGDLLICEGGEVGRAAIWTHDGGYIAYQKALHRVRPGDNVDARFLRYMLEYSARAGVLAPLTTGSTIAHLPQQNLRKIPFLLPPLSEQERIVEVLEDYLSRLDAGVDYLNAARRRCALYEDATIMRALGSTESRQDGVEQIINGHLPALAEGWSWQTLGEVADVVGGVTKDAKKQSDPSYIEVPYLRVANVQRARLDLENVTTLRVPPAKVEALRLLKGDVLMNEGGDRDKLARGWVWDGQIEECIHQNHVFRARPRDTMRSEWLAWCANTYGARWAQRHGKQSVNLASISLKVIKTMPIPVPPLSEQDERLAQIHEAVSRSRRLIGEVEIGLARADRLRRSLLTAAFSGRLTGAASAVERVEEIAADVVEAEAPEGVLV